MNRAFLPVVVALGALALALPQPFVAMRPAIVPLLGIIMFAMGLTLVPADFVAVGRRPRLVVLGTALQLTVMPATALALGTWFGLPPELVVGFVILGSCPGGTASNVMAWLAGGDVALSVSMTLVSTVLAPLTTPLLVQWLAGHAIALDTAAMMLAIVKIVALPVAGGLLVRRWLGGRVERVLPVLPGISMVAISLVIAIVLALSRPRLVELPLLVALAVILHNLVGLTAGYFGARALGAERAAARTIALEVGMQNSGLGAALATTFVSPVAAVPSALFSLWHNVSGAALASRWARRPPTSAQ